MKNFKWVLLILLSTFLAINIVYGQNQEKVTMDFKESELELEKIKTNINTINTLVSRLKQVDSIKTDRNTTSDLETIENNLKNMLSNIENSKKILYKSGNEQLENIVRKYNDMVSGLNEKIKQLNINLKNTQEGEVKKIAELLNKTIDNSSELSEKLSEKERELDKKNKKLETLETDIKKEKEKNADLEKELKDQKKIIDYLDGGDLNFGLAIGFNGAISGRDAAYIVDTDSKAREVLASGVEGMISAVVIWQLKKIDLILNVPLIEIGIGSSEANQLNSIFNKSIDVGIGIGIPLSSKLSICAIMNVSTHRVIDEITLEEIEFAEPVHTKIDISKYPTTTKPSISLTVGLLMKFGKGKKS